MGYYRIAKSDIEQLLARFSERVYESRAKKLDYQRWQMLKKANFITISTGECASFINVSIFYGEIVAADTCDDSFIVEKTDAGFGSFLFGVEREGELRKMSDRFDNLVYRTCIDPVTCGSTRVYADGTVCASGNVCDWGDVYGNVSYVNIDSTIGTMSTSQLYIPKEEINKLTIKGDNLEEKMEDKETMKTGIKFNFGTCENDNVRLSMYGIAIKNASGEWVAYDAKTASIINVDIFNFDGGKYLFKMPVAINDIKIGDTIVHNGVPVHVTGVTTGTKHPVVVDPKAGEEKIIIPPKNMFGFDFVTKVVSLFDMNTAVAPSNDNPFGNMWPLMLADGDIDPMMLMMMSGNMKDMNPMMMYALMSKDKKDSDLGLLMAMSMMTANKQECLNGTK